MWGYNGLHLKIYNFCHIHDPNILFTRFNSDFEPLETTYGNIKFVIIDDKVVYKIIINKQKDLNPWTKDVLSRQRKHLKSKGILLKNELIGGRMVEVHKRLSPLSQADRDHFHLTYPDCDDASCKLHEAIESEIKLIGLPEHQLDIISENIMVDSDGNYVLNDF